VELTILAEDLRSAKESSRSSETLAAAADELSATIAEGSQAAKQIMLAINMIDRTAEMQSAATEQSSRAVRAIEKDIAKIMSFTNMSETNVKEVAALQDANRQQTEQMVDGIFSTLGLLSDNMKMLLSLESRMRQVDKIVYTIDRVGIQTNMLAVNGAIEASRAGKYGRGFAVVASDIRNLARETAANADQIKELIRDVQNQVMMVVRDLVTAQDMTRSEVEKARRVIQDMERYRLEMQELVGGIETNNNSLQEVELALAESKNAVEQIASAATEAAAATKQASSAGQEQNLGFVELSRAIEEIAIMADDIQM